MCFLSGAFTIYKTSGEERGYFIYSFLPLTPTSQTISHQPGFFCREITIACNQWWSRNRALLLATKLRVLKNALKLWRCSVTVVTTAKLHITVFELGFSKVLIFFVVWWIFSILKTSWQGSRSLKSQHTAISQN